MQTLACTVIHAHRQEEDIRMIVNVYMCLMKLAERVGFEPTVPFRSTQHFQCCALDHSATSPK